ncbi:MAG: YicC family protein [Cryomorphaceae bacterium]|nr:YicC family protein [Cryomorphaceae bacterium]
MIQSMTGYGKAEGASERFHFIAELRTLNSKSFDINFRIPQLLRPYEAEMRKHFQQHIVRGKTDVQISLQTQKESLSNAIDTDRLKSYVESFNQILTATKASGDPLAAAMRMPDVFNSCEEPLSESEFAELMAVVEKATHKLVSFRESEGAAMERDLKNAIEQMADRLEEIPPMEAERTERLRNKFLNQLNELKVDVNRDRFEQEMIYYLEKLDINEEKVRLKQHLDYFLSEMSVSMHGGRKLNFIAQEMGREINTLGSKCQHEGIQKRVVEMKEMLEQIKEINLNIV